MGIGNDCQAINTPGPWRKACYRGINMLVKNQNSLRPGAHDSRESNGVIN